MTHTQLARRDAIVARHEAALSLWPQGRSDAFRNQVISVARDLEALADEADAAGGDRLERARTWRFAALAHADVAVGQTAEWLKPAAAAFAKCDALLAGTDNPIERMKLDFAWGRALFRLSEGKRLDLAIQSRDRLASALRLARAHMPAGVPSAEEALADAEKGLKLVRGMAGLDERIAALRQASNQQAPAISGWQTDLPDLPEQLRQLVQQAAESGTLPATHQPVLSAAIEEVADMIAHPPSDVRGMIEHGRRLEEATVRLAPVMGETGQPVPAWSRAAAVWKALAPLKTEIYRASVQQHGGAESKTAALALYRRCAEADTSVHAHGDDDEWVRHYEHDVLRPLASEVRAHLLGHHLTLARPVWPSSSHARDANAVFFAGRAAVKKIVREGCARAGLTLRRVASGNRASEQWDALRTSHAAVVDFTKSPPPAYELGIALAIGSPVVIIAAANQDLPFDVDIDSVALSGGPRDIEDVAAALEHAVYGTQRLAVGSSLPATREFLHRQFDRHSNVVVQQSLRLLNEPLDRDAVPFRRLVETTLGWVGDTHLQTVLPPWPGRYPDLGEPLLFHVTPFGPAWAVATTATAREACGDAAKTITYVRGDAEIDPDIMRSIWDCLCAATHVLVDVTGLNANVLLELGIAHTLGRNVLIIVQHEPDGSEISFVAREIPALAKTRIQPYSTDPVGLAALRAALDRFLSAA